jgi:hypothetical protein
LPYIIFKNAFHIYSKYRCEGQTINIPEDNTVSSSEPVYTLWGHRKRKQGSLFKEIVAESFSNWQKEMDSQKILKTISKN